MKFPPFEYACPVTVDEVVKLLASHKGEAKPLAGGQSLLPMMAFRMAQPSLLVDLRKVPGVAETLDWAATLAGLDVHDLRQEPETIYETMICLLKTREDRSHLTREVTDRLLGKMA